MHWGATYPSSLLGSPLAPQKDAAEEKGRLGGGWRLRKDAGEHWRTSCGRLLARLDGDDALVEPSLRKLSAEARSLYLRAAIGLGVGAPGAKTSARTQKWFVQHQTFVFGIGCPHLI